MSSEALERIARNKNVARAAARQLSVEQLTKLIEVIGEVIEQKHEDERQRQAENSEKARKLEAIREQLEEAGLSVDDLVPQEPSRKRGRPPKKKNQ
ncbi:H-NS family nucleoid-associated regulatory protein [Halomonas halocynthiae]|uniref:H-NS family histone-like protein n=1 Tax=Halomonas halocynthiae TaxID=176290 RepID=UPI000400889D|nr:H-NS family nucleoid-associated regulatory protein [Halomonas halocynthiae]